MNTRLGVRKGNALSKFHSLSSLKPILGTFRTGQVDSRLHTLTGREPLVGSVVRNWILHATTVILA